MLFTLLSGIELLMYHVWQHYIVDQEEGNVETYTSTRYLSLRVLAIYNLGTQYLEPSLSHVISLEDTPGRLFRSAITDRKKFPRSKLFF